MSLMLRRMAMLGVTNLIDAEVLAWKSRVIANSGTVSDTTLAYVDTFVKSLKAAGLRSRFLRLNLFVGDQLAAALTPLFLNSDGSGTFLGNTYDTNNNFVSGDYAESGASGGLIGNASNKYLATGFNPSTISEIGEGTGGLITYNRTASPTSGAFFIGSTVTTPSPTRLAILYTAITGHNYYGMENNPGVNFGAGKGLAIGIRTDVNTKKVYFNGSLISTSTVSTVGKPNSEVKVFCSSLNASQYLFTNALLNGYAIVNGIASDAEAATISTLLNNFYTGLSRNEY